MQRILQPVVSRRRLSKVNFTTVSPSDKINIKISSLLEDNKALERLTKSKEAALLETEKILRSALKRALIVEDIHNQNIDLKRQVEICQEENRLLEKTNRQKVLDIGKPSQSVQELEEAVLTGGASANVVREYKHQISELNNNRI